MCNAQFLWRQWPNGTSCRNNKNAITEAYKPQAFLRNMWYPILLSLFVFLWALRSKCFFFIDSMITRCATTPRYIHNSFLLRMASSWKASDAVQRAKSSSRGSFELDLGDAAAAIAEYSVWKGPDGTLVLEIPHTFVPQTHRGQGLAGVVTEAAFHYAQEHRMKVLPTCTYVAGLFLDKRPHLASLCISRSLLPETPEPATLPE